MKTFVLLTFLFLGGSIAGWILEVFFRKFFSKNNPKHIWINPGFLNGPYLPLYGTGLVILYFTGSLNIQNEIVIILIMGIMMTIIEFITGFYCLKVNNERYWDYSNEWGNIEGVICPKFSIAWLILCAIYYYLLHPFVDSVVLWLLNNPIYSFVVGLICGIFLVDLNSSLEINKKFKEFARDNDIVVQLDLLKMEIKERHEKLNLRHHFFNPLKTEISIHEHLKNIKDKAERIKHKVNGR